MKIFFDGGCRPNPGRMEIAVVAGGVVTIDRDIGQGTSMDAEWLALLCAAELARQFGGEIVLLGDSRAVIAQATGLAKCREPRFRDYLDRYHALGAPRLRHIARTQNLAGIALARAR
ncbi:ribonuclease H family protein [Sphingomonas immobilis]|uniref:Ribonuclease HI n=1 Tax=Sphingomonas immobilis TaxID=3063997 RepID=A0ABT8ZXX8_9SPHN|nr:ribonuclease HI [Sphingomonas sp. CA1-15]MDO7842429.1 ribonuclease HI [Sphingomonas sp. CA1-15]